MKYSREKDEICFQLSKTQSRLFEMASKEKIPSAYFAKVFYNSPYSRMMDDLSFLDIYPSDEEIFNYIKDRVKMNRGTVLPDYIMSWIGYLFREWSYTYDVKGKSILKRVPLSYLSDVYLPYHSLEIQKAILLIARDRKIDLNESLDERVKRIIKMTL